MKKIILQALKISIPIVIGAYLVWYMIKLIQNQGQDDFWATISSMNYGWIIASLFIGFLSHLARAHRWKYLLEAMGYKTNFSTRYNATMVGYIVNMVIPRAGEASRAGVLLKTDNIPFLKTFGTIIAERVIDLFMLGIVGLITIALSLNDFFVLFEKLFSGDTSNAKSNSIWIISIIIVLLIFTVILIRRNLALRQKVLSFINDLKTGLFSVFKSKKPWAFVFYTLAIWILYIFYFGICFFALDDFSSTNLQLVLMAFIAGTIGVMLTPGGLGSYPIFVGTVISFYLYPEETQIQNNALALASVIWLSQTCFLIVMGLISLLYVSKKTVLDEQEP